ncbi:ubiquitin-like domain-containing protein [Desulfosporosinus sp. PR]|uniref:ubiquitin-like domain-containing protein n=1 Tax=Candidatus Desulfosporosinus nitrosoreducens TaxID=3401928 RepID=UPI0027E9D269|nr:ubiquitin-like domain-containing protein [Desulfosporosinus sp. PR]MDQ7092770.1 ubiquitin-like domain-containing protein [Desulfosporosinus sp. PR]
MFQNTRTWVLSLVRKSPVTKLLIVFVTFFIIGSIVLACNVKTINASIDGKTVRVTTIFNTVGKALAHSKYEFYPEDVVVPGRDTKITNGMTVTVTSSIPVRLTVDEQTLSTRTTAKTVGEAIKELSERYGLQIKDVDEVNEPRSEALSSQMDIKVRRTVPVVVQADGKTMDTYLAPRTVAEALKKLNIVLGAKDKVSLALNHVLAANDQLRVIRVAEQMETIQDEIPYQTVTQPGDYPVGLPDKVISRGSNGLQEQTVRLTLEDGKEVNREILGQRVLVAPTNQLVSRGAQTSVSRGGKTINFKRAYVMRASAYSIPGTTSTGAPVRWGVVAVDPRVIPLGASVYVDGYGSARALDTGGAIQGNRIDLYMDSEDAAASWGVRNVLVYVQ